MRRSPSGRARLRQTLGARIRRLREGKGISRREVAEELRVDLTAVAGWEAGKYFPRPKHRIGLARILGVNPTRLFSSDVREDALPIAARLVDTIEELPQTLMALTNRTQRRIRALRLAAPYTTAAYVQREWRSLISERVLGGSLEVQRAEIFYDLRRLQETLFNIFRYDGRKYHVKSYCPGISEVVPAMGGYFFDDEEFLLGAYWTAVPPDGRPGLRVSGEPFQRYFGAYWDEIWRRGTLLNIRGPHDLSAVRTLALQLGLRPREWKSFVEEASALRIGDGAPPLV